MAALAVIEFRYYDDGRKFVEQIHRACDLLEHLLSSKTKSDTVEAINFFVTAHFYRIEACQVGSRSSTSGLPWDCDLRILYFFYRVEFEK